MKRKEYEAKLKEKLQLLEAEVDRLHKQITDMEEDLSDEHLKRFAELKKMQRRTQETFKELIDASDDAFDSIQTKLEDYWSSLGREIKAYDEKMNN